MSLPPDTQLFPPSFRGNFPAMARTDRPIWERWLDKHANEGWEGFAYNLRLGGQQPPPGTDPQAAKMWRDVTSKRIDALGVKPDSLSIIEVREGAKGSAIGQLLGYAALWAALAIDARPVKLLLVTDSADADTALIAFQQGVDLEEI